MQLCEFTFFQVSLNSEICLHLDIPYIKTGLIFFKHTPKTKGYLKKGKKKMCPKNLNWNNFPEPEGFQNRQTTSYCSDLIKAEKLI